MRQVGVMRIVSLIKSNGWAIISLKK